MRFRFSISHVALVLFSAIPILATAQEPLSLTQAVETAISNAYTLKIAEKNKEIATKNNRWGEAGRYPTVTASINNANNYSSINNPTSFLNGADLLSSNGTFGLDAQWTLFDGGRVHVTKSKLAMLVEQSGVDAKVIADNVAKEVSKAYFNVLVQQKRLSMQKQLLTLSRDKIKYIEAKREYGQATEFDLLQIKDAYLNDSIQWLIQQTNYRNATQNLALAMGLDMGVEQEIIPTDTLSYNAKAYDFEALKSDMLNSNQQIRAERVKMRIAEFDVSLQKANLYPKISLGASLSEQLALTQINGKQPQISNEWKGGSTFAAGLNLSITYTIFNGGKIRRAIEVADLRRQISSLNILDLERKLGQQLKIAHNLYLNQNAVLALSQQMLANSERNLMIAEERFVAGTLDDFDFRTIQINYVRSVNTVQDAFLNAKNTEFDLLLLSGTLLKAVE